jgi:hypothetical protein
VPVLRRLALVLFVAALPQAARPLGAQSTAPKLEIIMTPGALSEGPAVATAGLLADPRTRDPLVNGAFPTGIHYRLELWRKGGLVNDFDGRSEWDVLVSYDPTKRLYTVVRKQDDDVIENFGAFASLEAAEAQFGRALRIPLRPNRPGQYYYHLSVDVKTLTENDLDALQQWMRGPNGKSGNPLSVVGKGIGKLLSRVLGGAVQHYQATSGTVAYP